MNGAALVVAASLLVGQQREPEVFGTELATVYVDVVVTRDGRPVAGLTGADFVVRDNGVVQRAQLAGLDAASTATIFVLDASASVSGDRLLQLQRAGHAWLDGVDAAAPAALIAFGDDVTLVVGPAATPAEVGAGLDAIAPGGSTALYDALFAALVMPVPTPRRVIVAFTDGDDTVSWLDHDAFLAASRRSDALIHIVSIKQPRQADWGSTLFREAPSAGAGGFAAAMTELAEVSGGAYWEAEEAPRLRDTFVAVLSELTTRYVLSYSPEGVATDGEHRIDVSLDGKKGVVRARRGYVVP